MNKSLLFLIVSLIGGLGCSHRHIQNKEKPFNISDIKSAEKLIGLEFSDRELDTMYDYLLQNLKGYDSLRKNTIDHEVWPALYFDPRPSGYNVEQNQQPIIWDQQNALAMPEKLDDLAFYTIEQLAYLLKNKLVTSTFLTKFFIDRIKRYDGLLQSTITITEELALEQAKKADMEIAKGNYKGLLHGIPYGVKDLLAVKGYKTTWGAAPYKDQIFDFDATVVEKLEHAGAVLIAKLVSGSLARGDVWYGGKTKNPWDTLQGASGSSAGSAAATAAGLVPFSIGTETLGSIVMPSARCGVTGLRPTYGRVSRYGVMPLAWSMDKVGPICRTPVDCAIVFDIIRGPDPKDRTVFPAAFNLDLKKDVSTLKVGYLKQKSNGNQETREALYQKALDEFKALGVHMELVALPENFPFQVFDIILRAEAGAFFDELVRSNGDDLMVEQTKGSRANSLRQSRFIPAVEYLQANRYRSLLIETMHQLISKFDVIISPTQYQNQGLITNLTGHPALVIPTGFDEKGHPQSVTLIANLFDEASLIVLGQKYLQATRNGMEKPPLFSEEDK